MLLSAGKGTDSLAVSALRRLVHPSGPPASRSSPSPSLFALALPVHKLRRSNPLFGFGPFPQQTEKHPFGCFFSAGKGTRTLDVQLGKLTLYQLSYSRDDPNIVNLPVLVKCR